MKRRWLSPGQYLLENCDRAGCHWWRTCQPSVIHTNVLRWKLSYTATCETHSPGVSVSYLSKTRSQLCSMSQWWNSKEGQPLESTSSSKEIHSDESVHILNVSTSTLIWNRCFINNLGLQTPLSSATHQPELKRCGEQRRLKCWRWFNVRYFSLSVWPTRPTFQSIQPGSNRVIWHWL